MLTTAKLNATGHRWVTELADFSFTIKFRPGHANKDAEALSRLPMDIDSYMKLCTGNEYEDDVKACCVGVSAVSNDSSLLNVDEVSIGPSVDKICKKSILDAQKQDQVVRRLLAFLKTEKWPRSSEIKHDLPPEGCY